MLIPWLGGLLVILLLCAAVMKIIDQQQDRSLKEAQHQANEELGLLRLLVHDALQRRNYQIIDELLKEWGKRQGDIQELRVAAANGFLLGYYLRPEPAREVYRVTAQIPYSYTGMATLELVKDLKAVANNVERLRVELFSGAILLAIVFGLLLWHARQLRKAQERLRLVVEFLPNAILLANAEGEIVLVNAKTEQLFGYKRQELIGQPVEVLMPGLQGKHRAYRKVFFAELQARAMGVGRDLVGIRKDGSEVPVEIGLAPVRMEKRALVLAGIVDLSERKRAQEELARYRDRLEELVAERTTALEAAQHQLIQKERLATLGQLTATVSHELRNPLGTIRGSLFLIAQRVRDKGFGVEFILDRADRSIARCDNIIGELLSYTRTRDLDLQRTKLDSWLVEVLAEQALPRGVSLQQTLRAPVEVSLDPDRFRQVVVNILRNACEALAGVAEGGGGNSLLRIKTRVAANRAEILFEDTGPGIPADVKEHIFEPLYSTKGFGVGLGLPIVQQIMEQHRGGVEITSEVGQGTQVLLWLPLTCEVQENVHEALV